MGLSDRVEKAIREESKSDCRRDVNRLKAKLSEAQSDNESLLQLVDMLEKRQQLYDTLESERRNETWEAERKKKPGPHSAIVLASDWHFEEVVQADQVHNLNAYNPQIAEARVKHFFSKTAEYWDRYTAGAEEMIFAVLGDMITGFIHEELEETNSMPPTDAALMVRDLILDGIQFLKKNTNAKRIVVPCCFGNHSRTTKKTRVKTGWRHSFEYGIYNHMARTLEKEKRVRVITTRGRSIILDSHGRKVRFHHGDDVRYGGGVGGITIPLNKKIAGWNRSIPVDLDCLGHFHSFTFGGNFLVNGSLIGMSEYGLSLGVGMEPPTQAFAVFDGRHGVRTIAKIICS